MSRFSVVRHLSVLALILLVGPLTSQRAREATRVAAQEPDAASAGTLSFTDITVAAGMSSGVTGSHGAFWADATGDGLPDLFLSYNECRTGLRANRFYRNLGGFFVEEAAARGLARVTGGTHGGAFADLDNDGDYDLVTGETYGTDCVSTNAPPALPNRMFRNDGGVFADVTPPAMASYADYTRSILAFDLERDGDLDIFAVNGDRGSGEPIPDRNEVYRNDGGFNFTGITSSALVSTPAGQAGTDTDYDGDGDVDILVPDFGRFVVGEGDLGVLRNDGNSVFTKVPRTSIGIVHAATTGITTGDLNNDGLTDLVLMDQDRYFARPLGFDRIAYVYLNAGGGTFTFVGEVRGIPGYTAALGDLDNDGDLDLVFPGFPTVLLNNGSGAFSPGPTYPTPVPPAVCPSVPCAPDPRTISFADVDADGDLDFVLTTKFSVFHLFRNNFDAGNWLKVRLTAPNGQAGAYGAKVRVYRAGTTSLIAFREAKNVYGYLSQDDPVMHIGLGSAETVDVEVTYLDGSRVTRQGIAKNRTVAFFGTSLIEAPGAPTNLTSAVAGSAVTLSWGAPVNGAAPTGYVVEAGSAPGLANLAIISTPGQGLAAVAPNGTYYVRVKAVNSAGSSPPSNEIVVVVGGGGGCTAAPGAPGPLSFGVAGSLVTLNWSAPTTGSPPTTYLVEAGSFSGAANLVVIDIGGPIPGLQANAPPGTYFVRVRARNACGTGPVSNEVVVPVGP